MNEKENGSSSIFSMSNLVIALIGFVVYLVGGISLYYMNVGHFVDAQLFGLYLILAAVGALALFFRWYWFAAFYFAGSVLAWFCGKFVGGLKGAFAPTAGFIAMVAIIVVFSVLGFMLQWKSFQKKWARKREERESAKAAKAAEEARRREEEEARKKEEEAAVVPVEPEPPVLLPEENVASGEDEEEAVPEGDLFNAMMNKLND